MKLYPLLFIVIASLACQRQMLRHDALQFDENRIGPFRIGQSRASVLDNLKNRKWTEQELIQEGENVGSRIEVLANGEGGFSIMLVRGVVDELRVTEGRIRNINGIGVGSTLKELRAVYSKRPHVLYGEDGWTAVFDFETSFLRFGIHSVPETQSLPADNAEVLFVSIIINNI